MKYHPDLSSFKNCLADLAFREENSRGRFLAEDSESLLSQTIEPFHLDCIKLSDSKAYRRLKGKMQVQLGVNPFIRCRDSHTVEVHSFCEIAAVILGLNVYLCRAIALGHDLGHVPYGHDGERFISKKTGKKFRHERFAIVIFQEIERKGRGLNLMYETKEGVFYHSKGDGQLDFSADLPQEYKLVMYGDKIRYVLSDWNDALRTGIVATEPHCLIKLGADQRERLNNCLYSLVKESANKQMVSFTYSDTAKYFEELRHWMYENVYYKIDREALIRIMNTIYFYISEEEFFADCDPAIVLALMTEREIESILHTIVGNCKVNFDQLGITEILPYIKGKQFAFENPIIT